MDPELRAIADEAMADIKAGNIGPREIDVWWERRRPNEPTADYLGRVLAEAGAPAWLVRNARDAHYDDYFCPAEVADGLETLRLVRDVRRAKREVDDAAKLDVVDRAVRNGEFDGTKAESDRWAASESGQSAMRELVAPKVPKVGRNELCPCGSGRKYKLCHGA